jgi:hypothetical protein
MSNQTTQIASGRRVTIAAGFCALLGLGLGAWAQDSGEQSPREAAPTNLDGYWVSVISEDWRWRMQTPPKGDYASIPLNDAGREMAERWDPERDEGTCRPYGAAGIMRMPMRIRIEWDDDDTIRIETDHGEQTRLLHFDSTEAASTQPSLQGDSVASWDGRSLKVVTTNVTPGYLRRNGVPYSGDAVVTEYFDRHAAYGDEWVTVTTIVEDPAYLSEEYITSSSFKQLPNGRSWNPVACENR